MGSWSHDCSSSAGLLDSYTALVLYLAGVALHQQPMGSRSHDCSSYVGCGGIPCSILVSPNASLHKWQQAVAPGWLPYMVPQNWIQARTMTMGLEVCASGSRGVHHLVTHPARHTHTLPGHTPLLHTHLGHTPCHTSPDTHLLDIHTPGHPPPDTSLPNKWAVRILLECFFVNLVFVLPKIRLSSLKFLKFYFNPIVLGIPCALF